MKEPQIIDALQGAVVEAVAAISFDPTRVKYAGLIFEPPSGEQWLEVVFLFANPAATGWGGDGQTRGTMRLILHTPPGTPAVDAVAPLTQLATVFTTYKRIGNVQISSEPNMSSAVETPAENLYPLNVRFEQWKN